MLQKEHGLDFPLIHASAEDPPLPDASFDLVFSEYGAAIWCDPYVWIPHAHRLLRPGGGLIFLCHSVLDSLCSPLEDEPTQERLLRPQRGLGAIEWPDGIDFHQGHGERIKLLRDTGFEIEALHELYAPDGDPGEVRYFSPRGWAQRWPSEEVWVARRSD
jgi:SAM-dependent methyltransferase